MSVSGVLLSVISALPDAGQWPQLSFASLIQTQVQQLSPQAETARQHCALYHPHVLLEAGPATGRVSWRIITNFMMGQRKAFWWRKSFMRNHHRLHDGSKEDFLMKDEFHEKSSDFMMSQRKTSWWRTSFMRNHHRLHEKSKEDFLVMEDFHEESSQAS